MKNQIIKMLLFGLLLSSTLYAQKTWSYTDKENGFTISYPSYWNKAYPSKKSAVKFAAVRNHDGHVEGSVTLLVMESKGGIPQDSIFYHYAKNLRLRGDTFLDSGASTINNQKYYWFTTLIDNKLEYIKSLYYMTFKNNKVIVIQFSANKAGKYPEYEETFLQIITSLLFS